MFEICSDFDGNQYRHIQYFHCLSQLYIKEAEIGSRALIVVLDSIAFRTSIVGISARAELSSSLKKSSNFTAGMSWIVSDAVA